MFFFGFKLFGDLICCLESILDAFWYVLVLKMLWKVFWKFQKIGKSNVWGPWVGGWYFNANLPNIDSNSVSEWFRGASRHRKPEFWVRNAFTERDSIPVVLQTQHTDSLKFQQFSSHAMLIFEGSGCYKKNQKIFSERKSVFQSEISRNLFCDQNSWF